jgi:hypothetical protein
MTGMLYLTGQQTGKTCRAYDRIMCIPPEPIVSLFKKIF